MLKPRRGELRAESGASISRLALVRWQPHREAFKLQALYGRLPELVERLKDVEKKLGLSEKAL